MNPRALIVEDDPPTADSLTDILAIMDHESESVGDMEAARERLSRNVYDYAILDLAIPVAPGRFADREVGRQLLGEIRRKPKTALLPVLVVTGEDRGESEFIQSVQRTGGYDQPLLAYLQKRFFTCDTLTRKIEALLSGQPGVVPSAPPQKPTSAFSAQKRTMSIYRHRVDVCGVKIWDETESPDLRLALMKLNSKDADGRYIGIPGPELSPERNASNKISSPIRHFRASATSRLRADRDLECGPQDILANERRRGYYLQEWVDVEVVDADGPAFSTVPVAIPVATLPAAAPQPAAKAAPTFEPTGRQRSILEAMSGGGMSQKGLLAKLKVGKSTLNRDLAVMREAGLFTCGLDNQYALTEAGRICYSHAVPSGPKNR